MSSNPASSGAVNWRVARSCEGGACVGVARQGDAILIHNTANPDNPIARFSLQEWKTFVAGVKIGDFDHID